MPPASAEQMWAVIEEGLELCMTRLADGLTRRQHMLVYSTVYSFCTSQQSCMALERVPLRSRYVVDPGAARETGEALVGKALYDRLNRWLTGHCLYLMDQMRGLEGEELIRVYANVWSDYDRGGMYVSRMFHYLNRYWIKLRHEDNDRSVFYVATLAHVVWRKYVLVPLGQVLTSALMMSVTKQRRGDTVNLESFKMTLSSLVALGKDDSSEARQDPFVLYKSLFQEPFSSLTREHYLQEGLKFLSGLPTMREWSPSDWEAYRAAVLVPLTPETAINDGSLESSFSRTSTDSTRLVARYLTWVMTQLEKEEISVRGLMVEKETLPQVMTIMDDVLIRRHHNVFLGEFVPMLNDDVIPDLERMFQLLVRLADGIELLRAQFEKWASFKGLVFVKGRVVGGTPSGGTQPGGPGKPAGGGGGGAGAPSSQIDAKAYIDALLAAHHSMNHILKSAFHNNPGFVASFDRACQLFMNHNAITQGARAPQTPELLAKFIDAALRRSGKQTEAEVANAITDTMVLFKYVDDKDVFLKFYTRHLCRRLIQGVSTSQEDESTMVARLRDACGSDYTSKLQKMFADVQVSEDINQSYKVWVSQGRPMMHKNADAKALDTADSLVPAVPISSEPSAVQVAPQDIAAHHAAPAQPIDTTLMALSSHAWPTTLPTVDPVLPPELADARSDIEDYYIKNHSGRRLQWLWHMSRNEIQVTYTKQKHILITNTYQTIVLTQFNGPDTLSFQDIKQGTNFADDDLLHSILAQLVKFTVLTSPSNDVYALNYNFTNKRLRVPLNMPLRVDRANESADVARQIDSDRRIIYQAYIVRIMKARKELRQNLLLQETTRQLSIRFAPNISDVRATIDYLIEKEFLERDPADPDVLKYLA